MEAGTVIVGAGHSGGLAATFLRQFGYVGRITLLGEEPLPPYQRPPLSKTWLKGRASDTSLALRSAQWYLENNVVLELGRPVTAIDAAGREVSIGTDRRPFEHLIIATGSRPRLLEVPGCDLAAILTLRTVADAEAIRDAFALASHVAIIGGGYVGLEVAATARSLGLEVVVIEREERLLARVAGPEIAAFFQRFHEDRGTTFLTDATVERFEGREGRVSGVRLTDGRLIAAGVVVVGIGAIPNDELARGAGLATANGIVVDLDARTSQRDIFAIGDVAFRPLPHFSMETRLESVPNATEQARQAAAAITGLDRHPQEIPWFWSDQFDLKLQIAGMPGDSDSMVWRGQPDSSKFAIFHLSDRRIQAVEAVNSPAEFMGGKLLIAARAQVLPERLADPGISMKDVAG